jgi:tetratricopeptide (TPR) repeat protein
MIATLLFFAAVAANAGTSPYPSTEARLQAQISEVRAQATGPGLAAALNDLGVLYHETGQLLEAERCFMRAIFLYSQTAEPQSGIGFALQNLGGLRIDQGRFSDAERLLRRAGQSLSSTFGKQSREVAAANVSMAGALLEVRRYSEANALASLAISTLEGSSDRQLGTAFFILGRSAWEQGQARDAAQLLSRAVDEWRKALATDHPTYASGLVCLAIALERTDPKRSGQIFRDALKILESTLGSDHPYTAYTLLHYANYLKSDGDKKEAARLERRADAILGAWADANHLGDTVDASVIRDARGSFTSIKNAQDVLPPR